MLPFTHDCSVTGDGAPVGKYGSVVNLSVSLVDEATPARRRPQLIGISSVGETYEALKATMTDINTEIETLQNEGLDIDGCNFKFTFYVGADYKFILLVCGMQAANSNHACVFCDAKKCDYRSPGKARSRLCPGQPGVSRQNLLPAIPLERIVIDDLHMYLRTSDRLLFSIRREIPEGRVNEFVEVIRSKITCRGKITARDGKVEFSNLDKADRQKIISFLSSSSCLLDFLGQQRGMKLRLLLLKFVKVIDLAASSTDIDSFQCETTTLLKMFLSVFQSTMITPYFHILFFHVGEIIGRIGSLQIFTQQQVEKLNHSVTSSYYHTTNFKNGMRQVMMQHGRRLLASSENLHDT